MPIHDLLSRLPYFPAIWRYTVKKYRAFWNLLSTLLGRPPGTSPEASAKKDTPPGSPRVITYLPVPGSWQRGMYPHWPESAFHIPKHVPYGTVYYITKGPRVGAGATAHVERLLSGHVVKYPIPNPYSPGDEETNRQNMRIEAEVYSRLRDCPYIPKLISWEPESCCLTLQFLEKGDLGTYIRETPEISDELRRRWVLQAALALSALHSVDVVHCDINPRNFLLSADLDLHIADFAGSSVAGSERTVAPGPRFLPPGWTWDMPAKKTDDVFGLGSIMYFIMLGEEPYSKQTEEEVEELLLKAAFPDVSSLSCGTTIRGCWEGTFETAGAVVDFLNASHDTKV